MSGVEIHALTPERGADLLAFFDADAFTDNPWWAGCFCTHYERPDNYEIPDPATPAFAAFRAGSRALKAERLASGASGGYLAYRDGRVVGWLNAQPKEAYVNARQFAPAFDAAPGGPGEVGMIMCFIVAPGARGAGVGTALLRAAVEGFRAAGLRYAEGFARRPDAPRQDWETFATSNYHGTPSMYEDGGFRSVGDVGNYAVMRRAL